MRKARTKVRHLERKVTEKDYVPTLLGQIEQLGASCDLRVLGVEPQEKKESAKIVGPPVEGQPGGMKAPPKSGEAPAGGEKTSVDVNKLKAASSEQKGPYRSETVEITVSGTYWNVVRFLDKMTEFPKILAVNSVEVEQKKKTGANGPSPVLSVKIALDAYVLDDRKAQAKGRTPAGGGASAASGNT